MTVSTIWSPFELGPYHLQHRVVLAPLTRNRATKSSKNERTWFPNELMKQYYAERTTPGGLLISEATPVSVRASGCPGVPGFFTSEQQQGWKDIVTAVHEHNGVFFAQLWHQGRNTHSSLTGQQPESCSETPIDATFTGYGVSAAPFEVPKALSIEEIQTTQQDFVTAATNAVDVIGFDGIELHAGNGYLFDQFLHSNINTRTDLYGHSMQNRCRFLLETVEKICSAIGSKKVAVRLSPYGLFNQTYGEKRVEQWSYLCEQLGKLGLAYVHLIEPRFDELRSLSDKLTALGVTSEDEISLAPFRKALGPATPVIAAGGFGPNNLDNGIKKGEHDLVAFGRLFVSNHDLVDRLRTKQPLYKWQRSRFYGPFPDDPEEGYTVHSQRDFVKGAEWEKAQLAE